MALRTLSPRRPRIRCHPRNLLADPQSPRSDTPAVLGGWSRDRRRAQDPATGAALGAALPTNRQQDRIERLQWGHEPGTGPGATGPYGSPAIRGLHRAVL